MAEPIILEGVLTGFDQEPLGGVRVVADPRRPVVVHDGGVAVKTTRTVTAKDDDEDPTGSLNMPLVWAEGLSYRVYAEPDGILRELGVLDCDAHTPGSVVNVKALPPATAPSDEVADAAWRAWVREQLALLDPATLQQFIDDYLTDNPPSGGVTDHGDLDGRDATDQHPIGAITGLQAALDGKAASGHNHDGTYATAAQGSKADTAVQPAALAAETQARADADTALAADIANRQTAAQVDARVQLLIGAAPAALDTFEEIAARLADDADAVAALTTLVASKVPSTRTVNGKALSADVVLDAADVGAAPSGHNHDGTYVKPGDLATVATSGSYDDLDDKPTIPPGLPTTINARTAAYTLVSGDAVQNGTAWVEMNLSAAADLTVPAGVFTAGQRVDVLDVGDERVTFVAGSGMTLTGSPSLVSSEQDTGYSVLFRSAAVAVVVGGMATP